MENSEQTLSRLIRASLPRSAVVVAVCLVLALVYSFVAEPTYRVEVKLIVADSQRQSVLGSMSGIAGALGLPVDPGFSQLNMYAEYMRSVDLLRELVQTPLPRSEGDSTTVLREWGGRSDNSAKRLEDAIEELDSRLGVKTDPSAGLLKLRVDLFDPESASHLADMMVDHLNAFDASLKRWTGSNRSEFLQNRAVEVRLELEAAEQALLDFRLNNRVRDNPRLQLEEMRMLRDVALRTEILQTILAQRELADIESKTESPVLKSIQSAATPTEPVWPDRLRLLVVVGMLAFGVSVLAGVVAGRISENASRDQELGP